MELAQLIKKQLAYLASKEIAEICVPFFKVFHLNYFKYTRIYPDKTIFHLTNDRDFYYHTYTTPQFPICGTIVKSGMHMWKDYAPQNAVKTAATRFNHYDGITIFTNNKNYIEYFDLAVPPENHHVTELYLNQVYLLNQFLFYFKDKAAQLIEKAVKERLVIPKKMIHQPLETTPYDELLRTMKPSKFRLNCQSKTVALSRREYECLTQLLKYQTAKEAAQALNLSHRTVECYLKQIKHKTNCHFKNQLIDMFLENLVTIGEE